jgi:hypothetical protein
MLRSLTYAALRRPDDAKLIVADVIVVGLTPGAICAACRYARGGFSVAMLSGNREYRPGGMITGGLTAVDLQNPASLGGLSREVFDRADVYYGRARGQSYQTTPSGMLVIFEQMLAEHSIRVFYTRGIDAARKDGARLVGIRTRDGYTASGKHFVDGTYEGDLLAFAGVPYAIGREATYEFGEVHAGFHYNNDDETFTWNGVAAVRGPLHHAWRAVERHAAGDLAGQCRRGEWRGGPGAAGLSISAPP